MDIPRIPIDGLDAIATRLDRYAEHLAAQATLARAGTSEAWRGPAADRHREVVAGHASDLEDLAERLDGAAASIRHLSSTARARVGGLGRVDVAVGILP